VLVVSELDTDKLNYA